MKLTKKGEYALRALIGLGLAYPEGMRQIQDLGREEEIPRKFLEQILLLLRNAGYIQSKRGVNGGYFLRRAPQEVSLGEIIRLIDGPLSPVDCVSQSRPVRCPKEVACSIRGVLLDVERATAAILDRVTLADLCQRTKGMREGRTETLMYYI